MNDQSTKISYGKVGVNLFYLCLLYIISLIAIFAVIGTIFTTALNVFTPFINPDFEGLVVLIQTMLVIYIAYFLLGALSAHMNRAFIKNRKSALLLGVATGLALAISIPLLTLILIIVLDYKHLQYNFTPGYIGMWMLLLMEYGAISIISVTMGAYGSLCHARYMAKIGDGAGSRKIPGYLAGVVIMFILISLAAPIIVYLGHLQGDDYSISTSGGKPQFSTSRLDNDTISIVYDGLMPVQKRHDFNVFYHFYDIGGPIYIVFLPGDIQRFTIYVNGKDASSFDAISENHLNISIDPAGGLGIAKGSSVRLTGRDIEAMAGGSGNARTDLEIYANNSGVKDFPVYDWAG